MRQYLRALSPKVEFLVVIAGAFGLFIFGSIGEVIYPSPQGLISEAHLRHLLMYEPVMATALLIFLGLRGWTLQRVGLRPSAKETLIGLGLALAAHVAYVMTWQVAASIFSSQLAQAAMDYRSLVVPGLRMITLIAVSIVNPVFEELFVCGYVISALERARWPMWTAINVSVAIRLLYHLYQGPIGVVSIVPAGLIFAYWYARSDRLWPVIVAHAAFDFLGLLPYSQ